jgi:chromosome segregation ATPase
MAAGAAALLIVGASSVLAQPESPKERREDAKEKVAEKREELKEKREELKEKREELKEERDELKEKAGEKRVRAKELKEKEAKGELTDEEKKELEEMKARREELREKHKDLIEKHAKMRVVAEVRKRRIERRRDWVNRWKNHDFKHPAVKAAFTTHARRMARLKRAEYLATITGNEEAQAKVKELLDKEQARHDKHMETLKDKAANKGQTGTASEEAK